MKRKGLKSLLVLILVMMVFPVGIVWGQTSGITIKLNRDFGYGGMGNEIQGTFSIVVSDKGPFERVTFMMDEVVLGVLTDAPYRWQFSTDDYAPGTHQYWAYAETADGNVLESNRITGFVLSKEEANQGLFKIIGILLGSIAFVGLISWVVSNSVAKKADQSLTFESNGIPKGFTTLGGSVCPKCGKAFSFHFWKLNLLTHKVDRCPHCGKWVAVKSMTLQMMEQAVKQSRIIKNASDRVSMENSKTESDELNRQLDQSKYLDS